MNDTERAVLRFEESHPHPAGKQLAVRKELDLSWPRYWQMLGELIRRPDVVAEFPQLAKRVQRTTEAQQAKRASRRLVA
jgi:hypothetical protein